MAASKRRPAPAEIRQWLDGVPDPEIPVISVNDLGIVRDIVWQDDQLRVTITPTYSACPAISAIEADIRAAIVAQGIMDLRIITNLFPPWTTDWLSEAGREKLRRYGIAPPIGRSTSCPAGAAPDCPRCGAGDTRCVSQFGSTPCKAIWVCNACLEPFDYFKCH